MEMWVMTTGHHKPVNACRTSPFPATVEDEASNDEPSVADLPFDIEEGDRVWATGLIPEAQYIQATSTISQRLAESFAKNMEPTPTLLTGGKGSSSSIPDYVKTFGQVFWKKASRSFIFTKDLEEHRQITHWVLGRLVEHQLYLRPEKCKFEKTRIGQARWSLTLARFDFLMHHRPGTSGKPYIDH